MKYRKKPIVIDAVQWNGNNVDEVCDFMEGVDVEFKTSNPMMVVIPTLEGDMLASVGDFIIKGVKGEFYPCKPDIFEQTYEKVGN
ncbi:MAG: hypothetical protein GY861_14585 [bacterium]|nr:hypothetical protein [bacterium]